MFDKLKRAMSIAGRAEPLPAPTVPSGHALVPVATSQADWHHEDKQLGALDRTADSTRPTLMPAPALRSFDEEQRRTWWPAAAHARHLASVSGYLAYGVELNVAWLCGGDGLRANIQPNAAELGWTDEEARSFAARCETLFREWSNDAASCDAQGRAKFGAMQAAAVRSYLLTGDVLATLDYGPKRAASWRTAVSLIDPQRLAVPISRQFGVQSFHGIEFDERGRSIAYHVQDVGRFGLTTRLPVYAANGRKLVLHAFDGDAGTVRGTSPLASAVGGILQAMSAADAAVLSAHINAAIMGVLTSDLPDAATIQAFRGAGEDPLQTLTKSRLDYHEGLKKSNNDIQLGHGARVVHLATGERFELHAGQKSFSDYETILKHGLREAARALGLSYEALTSDKSQASYASLKSATVEMRAIIDRRRKAIIEPLCDWALEAVIEEAIANKRLTFIQRGNYRFMSELDAFRELKRFALRTDWIAPAIPDADAYKEARAAQLRMQMGLSSPSEEIGALGKDADAVFDQIALDRKRLKDRGLFLPMFEPGGRRPVAKSNGGAA